MPLGKLSDTHRLRWLRADRASATSPSTAKDARRRVRVPGFEGGVLRTSRSPPLPEACPAGSNRGAAAGGRRGILSCRCGRRLRGSVRTDSQPVGCLNRAARSIVVIAEHGHEHQADEHGEDNHRKCLRGTRDQQRRLRSSGRLDQDSLPFFDLGVLPRRDVLAKRFRDALRPSRCRPGGSPGGGKTNHREQDGARVAADLMDDGLGRNVVAGRRADSGERKNPIARRELGVENREGREGGPRHRRARSQRAPMGIPSASERAASRRSRPAASANASWGRHPTPGVRTRRAPRATKAQLQGSQAQCGRGAPVPCAQDSPDVPSSRGGHTWLRVSGYRPNATSGGPASVSASTRQRHDRSRVPTVKTRETCLSLPLPREACSSVAVIVCRFGRARRVLGEELALPRLRPASRT